MAEQQVNEPDFDGVMMIAEAILTEGYTYQDFTQITDEQTEAAYGVGFNLINNGHYHKAEKLFQFLCFVNQYEARFWMGLGVSRQQQRHFDRAVQAYAMVGILDLENPMPALRAAECYLALGKLEEAESGLTAALLWAGDKAKYEAARTRANALMEILARRKERRDGND